MKSDLQIIEGALGLLPDCVPDGWWCPQCQDKIACATCHECCPDCGTYLTDCQPDDTTGDAKKRAIAAVQRIKDAQAIDVDSWAKFITRDTEFYGDHACFECHPYSEIIIDGFRCVKHEAAAHLRKITKSRNTKDHTDPDWVCPRGDRCDLTVAYMCGQASNKTGVAMGNKETFKMGDRVRKKGEKGQWHGIICGSYSTTTTPEGYAIESERETGSVQIYPVGALEAYDGK